MGVGDLLSTGKVNPLHKKYNDLTRTLIFVQNLLVCVNSEGVCHLFDITAASTTVRESMRGGPYD